MWGVHDLPWCVTTGDDRAGATSGTNCAPAASELPAAWPSALPPVCQPLPPLLLLCSTALGCCRLPQPPAGPLLCASLSRQDCAKRAPQTSCKQRLPTNPCLSCVPHTHKLPPHAIQKEGSCTTLHPRPTRLLQQQRTPASVPMRRILEVKEMTEGVSRLLSLFSSTSTPGVGGQRDRAAMSAPTLNAGHSGAGVT